MQKLLENICGETSAWIHKNSSKEIPKGMLGSITGAYPKKNHEKIFLWTSVSIVAWTIKRNHSDITSRNSNEILEEIHEGVFGGIRDKIQL